MRIEIIDFNVLKEEISPNNILAISEIIAFMQTRFLIGYMGNRKMMKLINRNTRDYYRNMNVETLTPEDEPLIDISEVQSQDYLLVDSVVEKLNLTDNMKLALECRMAGLSYPEIGRVLEGAQSTVFEYFVKMRQRYTAIYG